MSRGVSLHFVFVSFVLIILSRFAIGGSQEGLILQDLKRGFDDPSGAFSNWNENDNSPCNWTGITCNAGEKFVEGVDLSSTNISGPFPSVVCRLDGLKKLSLANNYVNGSIPRDLVRCGNLQYLDLSQNLIVGRLPDFINELPRLQHLDLSGNNFSGPVPAAFGQLPELQVLNLFSNLLNATIPSFLGNLPNLLQFNLAYNPLTGTIPSELGNLKKLQHLWLAGCNLGGEIPETLGNLAELTNLDLSMNQLSGSIPESITKLAKVVQIELYQNRLSGPIPVAMGDLKALERFDASMNMLNGSIPTGLGSLNLESLNLYQNYLVGQIPPGLGSLTRLIVLKLFSNRLTGTVPENLGRNSELQALDIADNQLSGSLPPDLCKNKKLQIVNIFNNELTGKLPESLGTCTSLNTGAEMEIRLLLRIVLQFLFASCTLSARSLQWKSSPYHYDYMTIGQPSQSSDITHSLSDYIRTGEPSSPFVSLFQTTKPSPRTATTSSSCYCSTHSTGSGSSSCSCDATVRQTFSVSASPSPSTLPNAANISPSPSTLPNAANISPSPSTLPNAANISPSPSTLPNAANISASAGASRGRLNILGKIGIAIAVTMVSLLIFVAVLKAFKKASHDNNDKDSEAGSVDILTHTAAQVANPSGYSLEVGIIDTTTHTVEEVDCLEEGIGICTYTRKELAKATDNFTTEVGKGGSASVYRAKLPGNRLGAVKRVTDLDPDLFKQELSVLVRLPRHPRLVDLIGLCLQADERILVFEFISGGSLYDRLHKNKGLTSPLHWAARMDIAFQVAVALEYLHEEAKPPVLHRDVKSANVLLVDDNCAKLADFGLSKLGPRDNQYTVTAVRGSYGYMDPQYVKTRKYSAKSDVYSFGVLLLELVTGLKAVHEDTPLAEWTETYRVSEGIERFMTIVDRNMKDQINMMELQVMIKIANLCLQDISEERSSMREIVKMIEKSRNIKANGKLSDSDEAPFLGNGNLSDGGRCESNVGES